MLDVMDITFSTRTGKQRDTLQRYYIYIYKTEKSVQIKDKIPVIKKIFDMLIKIDSQKIVR